MRTKRNAIVAALTLSVFATRILAQTTVESNVPGAGFDQSQPALPTLHVYSRETIVDVLVTDDKGQPVRGLTRSDFTALFTFDPTQIALAETPDGVRTASIELDLGAFDFYGTLVTTRSQTFKITVTPAQYNGFFRTPLKLSLPIDLPHGQLTLRAGVFDTSANKAGTLEIPLTVPKK